jgi:hypothetical protein
LAAEGIGYCHWKSNNALDRSASGENDLDFLVSRPDIPRFTAILCRLGFKQARAPAEKDLPGVLDFFGYDDPADKLIHVHAHYQLILGHDRTKNHRLPIESAYLGSAIDTDDTQTFDVGRHARRREEIEINRASGVGLLTGPNQPGPRVRHLGTTFTVHRS